MHALTNDDIAHLAHLARLEVPADQLPHYAAQLGQILALFEGLAAIDTSAVGDVIASFSDLDLSLRPDVPGDSLSREAALGPSGRRAGDSIAVPRVLGGTEGGD